MKEIEQRREKIKLSINRSDKLIDLGENVLDPRAMDYLSAPATPWVKFVFSEKERAGKTLFPPGRCMFF